MLGGLQLLPLVAAVKRLMAKSADRVSVKDFPYLAKGDGVADDTAAIQACLDALYAAGGGCAYFPRGTYKTTAMLQFKPGVRAQGDGMYATFISFNPAAAGTAIRLGVVPSAALNYGMGLHDMRVDLLVAASTGVHIVGAANGSYRNVAVEGVVNAGMTGWYIDGSNISAFFNTLDNCRANHCHIGFKADSSGTTHATINYYANCHAYCDLAGGDATGKGFYFKGGYDSVLVGCNSESCNYGVHVDTGGPGTRLSSYGHRYEGNTTDLQLDSTVGMSRFIGSTTLDLTKVADNSGTGTNTIESGTGEDSRNWVPNDASGVGLAIVVNEAKYNVNGGLVTASFDITYPATANGAFAAIGGLPFTPKGGNLGGGFVHYNAGGPVAVLTLQVQPAVKKIEVYVTNARATNATLTGITIRGTVIYRAA